MRHSPYSATQQPSGTLISTHSSEMVKPDQPPDPGPGAVAFQGSPRHRKPPPRSVRDKLGQLWHWAPGFDAYRHESKHGTTLRTAGELLARDPAHMRTIKVLTCWQPWASCIAAASSTTDGKPVENRATLSNYRGLVAIHAGRSVDRHAMELPHVRLALYSTGWATPQDMPSGAVVAVACLADCHYTRSDTAPCCEPWGAPRSWHWELTGITRLAEPVPCRGFVGLFDAPPAVADAIRAQVVIL